MAGKEDNVVQLQVIVSTSSVMRITIDSLCDSTTFIRLAAIESIGYRVMYIDSHSL
jgi:hypothetical protein